MKYEDGEAEPRMCVVFRNLLVLESPIGQDINSQYYTANQKLRLIPANRRFFSVGWEHCWLGNGSKISRSQISNFQKTKKIRKLILKTYNNFINTAVISIKIFIIKNCMYEIGLFDSKWLKKKLENALILKYRFPAST